MSEEYRLVFRGEVAEGQHPAVVKKRIAAVMKIDAEKADLLFSGKTVVIRKSADAQTAARYQATFKKAGARLRVLPAATVPKPEKSAPAPHTDKQADVDSLPPAEGSGTNTADAEREIAASAADADPSPPDDAADTGLRVLPVGTDILSEQERPAPVEADIDTAHIRVAGASFDTDEPQTQSETGPDVGHLSLAELGAMLGTPAQDIVVVEIDVTFDLAEVGAILGDTGIHVEPPTVPDVDFELAPPGADLVTTTPDPAPAAPDTSHISLEQLPPDAADNDKT